MGRESHHNLQASIQHARQVFNNRATRKAVFPQLKPRHRLQVLRLILLCLQSVRQAEKALLEPPITPNATVEETPCEIIISPPADKPLRMPRPRQYQPEGTM